MTDDTLPARTGPAAELRAGTTRSSVDDMAECIHRRDDTNPDEGERKYGDVEFADPVNKKYPIDTEQHVRSAWSYINKESNAAKYDADEVRKIKDRITKAARKHGIEIDAD